MAKSASRGASKNSSSSPATSFGSGWLITGFMLGVFATLGGQWLLDYGFGNNAIPENSSSAQESNTDFEFYTLLGDIEVDVSDVEVVNPEEDNLIYWLQAASYRDLADAEDMRVSLLLQNMEANVKPFSHEGVLWHRVIVGPYQTRTQMNNARQILISAGVSPLLIPEYLSQ
ncbi:MAG: hypothetical protein HOL48_08075 [Porticoccaceae bacterium]|jgi:cell division protein FtsN|nr:hypothetical protein [Porticoccaceae bacterium]